jgi:RNA polymerase sigma-70 factor, ECF subfamily
MLRTMRVATTTPVREADGAPDASTETALLSRARAGDRDAFGLLVDAHLARVWNVVWRVLRHQEDTEDVVQEVFLTAWQGISGFRGEARFATWLQTIAVTRALNHRARGAERLRRASLPIDALAGDGGDGAAGAPAFGGGAGPRSGGEPADMRPASSPLRSLEESDLNRRLTLCLERLPSAWRAVIALRDGGDRPYEEIAAALNLALGTVRSRLARARLALRDCVEGA